MMQFIAFIILIGIALTLTFPVWSQANIEIDASDILNLETPAQGQFLTPQGRKVEYLFTDPAGCKVYRFWDGGVDAAYYSSCGGGR